MNAAYEVQTRSSLAGLGFAITLAIFTAPVAAQDPS